MSLEPGCFGSAIMHDADSEECKSCQAATQCANLAAEVSAFLKQELSVGTLPTEKKKSKKGAKKGKTPDTSGLSKKAAEIVQRVLSSGVNMKDYLTEGMNPFGARSSPFLRIACEMLLTGGFTKKDLREELKTRLNWSDGTANSHVSMICAAFPALGAVKEIDGTFIIERE